MQLATLRLVLKKWYAIVGQIGVDTKWDNVHRRWSFGDISD
jgi:hypothetical protein